MVSIGFICRPKCAISYAAMSLCVKRYLGFTSGTDRPIYLRRCFSSWLLWQSCHSIGHCYEKRGLHRNCGRLSGGKSIFKGLRKSASISEYVISTAGKIVLKSIIYGGYHQLKLSTEIFKVTAIITPFAVYMVLACPLGISTAPGVYQAEMAHQIL